ncbi:Gfo/Idh/MocA family oxidoreductase [Leifsonia sp. ZF2019]|uniref:Gfo/Idh/MocA family protein n=1 Tax=Leifsonia sp. ZF2019 TaxID=2781978 RepID=UPI001CBC928C|nr:Gfo/Idh/MocA family oxidoreductase [Leifsonia sp. ZF2019]UAJ77797.1 Gfo/Idh/MocA family oxidoreductase [Leifsonia sp. ZF2019]
MNAPEPAGGSRPAPIRSAIIGTGGIAHAHAQAIAALGDRMRLVAVSDIDEDRAAAFAASVGVERTYPSATALLAAGGVDLVHICTPPQTHAALAIEAMRAGVPALVEKPTALSLAEVDEIARVESETGVPTLTVFQHRFGAAVRHLRRMIADGELGRALVATCETLWYRTDDYFAVPWRGRWEVEGGGPTMGHGIHQFDLLLAVLGPWAEVSAIAARQSRPTDTEDVSAALVTFESGAVATVVNSLVSPRESSRLRFDFEFATVEVEHVYGYTTGDWTLTPAPGHEELAARWAAAPPAEETSSHRDQFAAIADALASGEHPTVAIDDARRTLEFAAATYASAFLRTPIAAGAIADDDPFMTSMSGGRVPWAPVKEVAR